MPYYKIRNTCIAIFFFVLLLASCKNTSRTTSQQIQLTVLDSFQLNINDDTYRVFMVKDSKYLALNSDRSKLAVFDAEGKAEKTIDKKGPGPDAYSSVVKLGFGKDNQEIIVVDKQKAIIYSAEGYKNINLSNEYIFPLPSDARVFFNQNQGFLFSTSSLKYSPEKMNYFDSVQTFTRINPDHSVDNLGGFHKESIYREKIFSTMYDPRGFLTEDSPIVYTLFPFEPVLYPFDLEANKYLAPISIDLKEFSEIAHRNDQSMEGMLYLLQQNASFKDFIVGQEYALLFYRCGLKKEEQASSLTGYNQISMKKRRYELALVDKETGALIAQPFFDERITHLIGFDTDDHLLFQHINDQEEMIIYKAKIDFK